MVVLVFFYFLNTRQHQVVNNIVSVVDNTDDRSYIESAKKTVEQYLEAVTSNNQQATLSLLSGDVLQTSSVNYRTASNKTQNNVVSCNSTVVTLNELHNFIILDSVVVFENSGVLNEQAYRLFLTNQNGSWKLFNIEPRQIEPPKRLSAGSLSDDVKTLIQNYLNSSISNISGNYDQFLTGSALRSQSLFYNSYGNVKTGSSFDTLSLTNVGNAPGYYFVRAKYVLKKSSPGKPGITKEKRTVLFEVIRIKDVWRINRWYVEEVEPIA
jgi:hypothetical protein